MGIKPDWDEIAQNIGNDLNHEELHVEWNKECNKWLESIAKEYGSAYKIEESSSFLILSNQSERYIRVFSNFLDKSS